MSSHPNQHQLPGGGVRVWSTTSRGSGRGTGDHRWMALTSTILRREEAGMTKHGKVLGTIIALSLLASCTAAVSPRVDGLRIVDADKEPQNWLSHGRTY